ncbi:MAG: hypothetical protein U0838_13015 [Chloroflexota bacterium]
MPWEARHRELARSLGVTPWDLERALDEDPRAMRWALLEPDLEAHRSARQRNGG